MQAAKSADRCTFAREADQVRAALAFLAGDRSTATLDALAAGMRRWGAQEGAGGGMPVNRYVGLPTTPVKLRGKLRDQALRAAAHHLVDEIRRDERYDGDDTITAVAQLLANAVGSFEAVDWPPWEKFDAPPAHGNRLQQLLWTARKLNREPLPRSPRHYRNILRGNESGEVFPESPKQARTRVA